jgi:hypothetical protein
VAGFFQFWEPPPPKPVPIRQSLRDHFPRELGPWRGEFRALDAATEKQLGADEYLNLDLREASTGRQGLVFVTYSANAMSNIPHVPWVCMTQAGYLLKRMDQRDVLVRALGNKEFRVNVAYFEPKPNVPGPPALMLQYFNVGGTYTTSREIARFLGTTGSIGQRGSYLSQTQVAVWLEEKRGEDPMAKTGDAYQAALGLLEQVAVVLETAFYPELGAPGGTRNAERGTANGERGMRNAERATRHAPSGFRVPSSGFRVPSSDFRVPTSEFRVAAGREGEPPWRGN